MPKSPPPLAARHARSAAGAAPTRMPPQAIARAEITLPEPPGIRLASTREYR